MSRPGFFSNKEYSCYVCGYVGTGNVSISTDIDIRCNRCATNNITLEMMKEVRDARGQTSNSKNTCGRFVRRIEESGEGNGTGSGRIRYESSDVPSQNGGDQSPAVISDANQPDVRKKGRFVRMG